MRSEFYRRVIVMTRGYDTRRARVCVCIDGRIKGDTELPETRVANGSYYLRLSRRVLLFLSFPLALSSRTSLGCSEMQLRAPECINAGTSCGAGSGHQGVPGVQMSALFAGSNVDRR